MQSPPNTPTPPVRLVERRLTLAGARSLRVMCPAAPGEVIEAALEQGSEAIADAIPYWVDIWPAAVALARRLIVRDLNGIRAIELGAGIGVAGLAAAAAGARVLITDRDPEALAVVRESAALNKLAVDVQPLDWNACHLEERFDLVLAADILYEERFVDPIAATINQLTAHPGEVVVSDPGRPYRRALAQALEAHCLSCREEHTHFYWEGAARTVQLLSARSTGVRP